MGSKKRLWSHRIASVDDGDFVNDVAEEFWVGEMTAGESWLVMQAAAITSFSVLFTPLYPDVSDVCVSTNTRLLTICFCLPSLLLRSPILPRRLYIDEIRLEKEYRGAGLGLYLIDQCEMLNCSNSGVVLITPFPLQYLKRGDRSTLKFKADKAKIADHYKLLGYRELGYRIDGGAAEFLAKFNGYMSPHLQDVAPGLAARW